MRALLASTVLALTAASGSVSLAGNGPEPDAKAQLAERYLALAHHAQLVKDVYSKQLKLSWPLCKDAACQSDLDKAIDQALDGELPRYEQQYAALIAAHVSEGDLRAAIDFAGSAHGQAIFRAEEFASEDLGSLNHELALTILADVSSAFCPKHKDICVRVAPSEQQDDSSTAELERDLRATAAGRRR